MRAREIAQHRRHLAGFRLRLQEAQAVPDPPPEAVALLSECLASLGEYSALLDQAETEHQARMRPIAPEAV